jgi:DNA-binding MarR family transcriptional regulator
MDEELDSLFFREKPTLALLALEEMNPAYAALIAKRIDSTFPHTTSILSQMEKHGLIRARPEGRVRYLELTTRGKKVARALKDLRETLREPHEHWNRLDRLNQILKSKGNRGSELSLGPLRRDLAKLKDSGIDDVRLAAEDMDNVIKRAIANRK